MPHRRLDDVNVATYYPMPTPAEIRARQPMSEAAERTVAEGREAIRRILEHSDPRLFIVVGPCSIHDPAAAFDYAQRLKRLADEVADTLFLVMRVYFEKPRTQTGWKGFINDPRMNDSFRIEEGIERAREFLVRLAELGLPAGTEALDPITPQYLGELVSWTAIGARTAESQTHREMASGLSTPVGFKNATDGDVDVAINAMISSARAHNFLGINEDGDTVVVRTRGNRTSHIVLRGGPRPNYDTVSISMVEQALARAGLPVNIVVDCSHANSSKRPEFQPRVMTDCVHQIVSGNRSIVGLMVESFIEGGNQPIPKDLGELRYGCSVTDACVDWATTEKMIREARAALKDVLPARLGAPGAGER